jgi:hypothetical protein
VCCFEVLDVDADGLESLSAQFVDVAGTSERVEYQASMGGDVFVEDGARSPIRLTDRQGAVTDSPMYKDLLALR